MLEIKIDETQFRRAEQALAGMPGKLEKATARSLNRAATAGKTQVPKNIKKVYTFKRPIAKSLQIKKASPNNLRAEIKAIGPVHSLGAFALRPARSSIWHKPVTVAVKRGGRKPLPHVFVTTAGGFTGAFTRVSKSRYPIEALRGPSIPSMMANENVINPVSERAQEVLENRLSHEVSAILGGF